MGAVISRHAESLSTHFGVEVGGMSAAFQRVLGGLAVGALAYWIFRRRDAPPASSAAPATRRRHALGWLAGAALFGPVIGVSCFQWALKGTPSAIVLAIVATTPIVLIPMTWLIEKDRPSGKSLLGAALAVAGVVAICLLRRA